MTRIKPKHRLLACGLAALMALVAAACDRSGDKSRPSSALPNGKRGNDLNGLAIVPVKYAQGFSIRKTGKAFEVLVRKPWQGATTDFRYDLWPAMDSSGGFDSISDASAGAGVVNKTIRVPLRRVVTLTTTNLWSFEKLGLLDELVGIGGKKFVCNPAVLARVDAGQARDVGEDVRLDLETLVNLKPDAVISYVVGNAGDGAMAKLTDAGLTTVLDGSYMEESPLGRAEWIKFTAAFFGKEKIADSIFTVIDSSYQSLAALTRGVSKRPTVFINAPFGGVWWMAGGRSYLARLLADAGADYLWADDTTRGSLSLGMEAVLGKAANAEFWLNPGDWHSLQDGKSKDVRHAFFKAFQSGQVFNNDRMRCVDGSRSGDGSRSVDGSRSGDGGNDFFETGAARPDWVLADLIAVFHPELLPNHPMRWYRKLEAQ